LVSTCTRFTACLKNADVAAEASRPLAAVSGTDNLISLFGLEPIYAAHVRLYEPLPGEDDDKGKAKPETNGAAERPKRAKQPNGYAYMLNLVSGALNISLLLLVP
jgi:hypothetical protein